MTDDDTDDPLTENEVRNLVAEFAGRILALTEDPGEHERIVNDLGDALDYWDKGHPFVSAVSRGVGLVALAVVSLIGLNGGYPHSTS